MLPCLPELNASLLCLNGAHCASSSEFTHQLGRYTPTMFIQRFQPLASAKDSSRHSSPWCLSQGWRLDRGYKARPNQVRSCGACQRR